MYEKALTISVEEAAKLLGLSRNAAYGAVRRGEIPSLTIGGRRLVLSKPLHRMLDGDSAAPIACGVPHAVGPKHL